MAVKQLTVKESRADDRHKRKTNTQRPAYMSRQENAKTQAEGHANGSMEGTQKDVTRHGGIGE